MKKMEKRKLFMLAAVIAVIICLAGCSFMDSIFYKAPDVGAGDLDAFTGKAATTEAQASAGLSSGVNAAVVSGQAVAETVESAKDFQKGLEIISLASPLFADNIKPDGAKSVSVLSSSTGYPMTLDVAILDETKNVLGGTVTVNKLNFSGKVSVDDENKPTQMDASFDAEAGITAKGITSAAGVTINELIFNAVGKGNATVKTGSVSYYAAIDMKLGCSISDTTAAGASGKYVIALNYIESGNLENLDSTNPVSSLGELAFTLTLKVYDNDNKETFSKTMNQDDVLEYYASLSK